MDIKRQASEILYQVSLVLKGLTDEQYCTSLSVLSSMSVGKHTRHILEFYQCLLDGSRFGIVDYGKRQRNSLLENNLNYAKEGTEEIMNRIQLLKDKEIMLNVSCDEVVSAIKTSVFRELAYNIEHTVHHLAIIKIGVNTHFPQVSLPENLGVANSTIKYQQQLLVK